MYSVEVEFHREEFVALFNNVADAINTEETIRGALTPNVVSDAVERVIWGQSEEDSDLIEYFQFLSAQAVEMQNV